MTLSSAEDGPHPGGTGATLVEVVRAQLMRNPPPPAWLRGRVLLQADEGDACTLEFAKGVVRPLAGVTGHPDTRICARRHVLVDLVRGTCAGVDAFLRGQLGVQGNLALSLQLDVLFDDGRRPERYPRPWVRKAGRVRTAYMEAGPRHGPAVVAIHGLGATNASLLPTIWDLAADYRVIAPDLPGHGASSAPRAPYNAAFFSRWLNDLLDELGVDRAVVMGNSLGGRISLEYGLDHPERVAGLVLLAPAVAFRKLRQLVPLVRLLRPELAALPLPMSEGLALAGLRSIFSRPSRISGQSFEAAAGEFVRVFRDPRHRMAFFAALRSIYLDDAFGERGFWKRLPDLEPPALFVWGRRDRLVPVGFARHVTAAVPAARTVILDDCGHVPQYEMPQHTNALIRDFFAELAW
ncbi:MAG TPA: alpha/beta fold hydrolase [Acidimicrobiales bacterium]|nr:alpha/beta fold hydrolase [Acidimicrobiales bacterium]